MKDKMQLAPITLFVYCRPDHTRRTVESLQANHHARESELIIYSDAAATPDKQSAVAEVRSYLETISGFRSITIHHRPENHGLARSIISGVTEILSQHDRAIVLEDDMVSSPHFLRYMNEALDLFENDDRVISIHAYVYPVEEMLPETFFLPGADCWGWATWRSGWSHFNPDGQYLLNELRRRKLLDAFNFNGAYPYTQMLQDQISGNNDSWAVRWYASALLAGKFTLYPGRSLIRNIGHDSSGTHCGESEFWNSWLTDTPIALNNIPVEISQIAQKAFERTLRKSQPNLSARAKNVLSAPLRRLIRLARS